ncbi:DUF3138 domain-containing protein [Silvimonas iriomotensis]|uniref:DUF3138 domain-containing protein n=1 Tax=Silvimonas iriomotensis TaxID=449662 RepID=A0ABQ2PBS4_9NEIS|nr:DUF3138 domain-containing protein [Silvimonas iriomotensis]GGP22719.1 hypothetical protein GCM10010970_27190 [Silvimonas iriomotensis]
MQLSKKHRKKLVVGASLLALAGTSHAAAPSTEELEKKIEALQAAVDSLKQQLQAQKTATTTPTPAPAAVAATDGVPAASAEADPASQVATRQDIDGLRADLENYKYQQQHDHDTGQALTLRNTNINGTIQARYAAETPSVSGGAASPSSPRNSGFSIPLALVSFSGSLYKDYKEGRNLDYRLQLGYAQSSPPSANNYFNVQDAYLRYSPVPSGGDLENPIFNLTLGQQLMPFGLEIQTDESLRPVINNAQFLNGTGLGFRQIGLIARGDYSPNVDYSSNYRAPLFEYAIGVVNGSGPNVQDNNNNKGFVARATYTLPVDYTSWLRELKIGASYYQGGLSLVNGSTTVNPLGYDHFYGVDVYYNHFPFGATYEYVQARNKDAISGVGTPGVKGTSNTFTAFYTWGEQFLNSSKSQAKYDDYWPKSYQAFARWDQWNPNTSLSEAKSAKSTIATLGLNVFFAQTTKFQLNFNRYLYENAAVANPATKSDISELLAQFQFGF